MYVLGITPAKLGARIGSFPGLVAYVILMTGVALAVAWLSWHRNEKHFLRLKRHFVYRRSDRNETPREPLRGVAAGEGVA
jgi:peptidoglycan/LPS O-acetylase OafA/YrhL